MKSHPPPILSGTTPHERFTELGSKLMAIPKEEVDERDKQWQARQARKRRSKKRSR